MAEKAAILKSWTCPLCKRRLKNVTPNAIHACGTCIYLGDPTGDLVPCKSCPGKLKKFKVRECKIHKTCLPRGVSGPDHISCNCSSFVSSTAPKAKSKLPSAARALTASGIGDGVDAEDDAPRRGGSVRHCMMHTIDYKGKCVGAFHHIMKTGGTYVIRYLKLIPGVTLSSNPRILASDGSIAVDRFADVFSFSFMRHPIAWYPSLFSQVRGSYTKTYPGEKRKSEARSAKCLEEFVQGLYEYYGRGYLLRHFSKIDSRTFIGRTETLVSDLHTAVDAMGLPRVVPTPPPQNVARKRPVVTQAARELIYKYEAETFEKYGFKK